MGNTVCPYNKYFSCSQVRTLQLDLIYAEKGRAMVKKLFLSVLCVAPIFKLKEMKPHKRAL